ncbi:MAG: SDR family oxidoreductase [Spartobacteria bacterium]|nr:SDR family oxidoreductase [Spartobacteria bacterium]
MSELLKGKKALVTGGTKGIGAAVARLMAAQGAEVMCWYHADAEAADALEQEIPGLQTRSVNVSDPDAVRDAVKALVEEAKTIDILVNNAGIQQGGMLAGMDDKTWHRVMDTNLDGAFYVSREVMRQMIFQRSGRMVNVASLAGVVGLPGAANYSASKGGLIAFTKALAQECARYGILVNAVSPGMIQTELTDHVPPESRDEIIRMIPLGRMGTPEEVAQLILFLSSDLNTYITGQNYIISGGL